MDIQIPMDLYQKVITGVNAESKIIQLRYDALNATVESLKRELLIRDEQAKERAAEYKTVADQFVTTGALYYATCEELAKSRQEVFNYASANDRLLTELEAAKKARKRKRLKIS